MDWWNSGQGPSTQSSFSTPGDNCPCTDDDFDARKHNRQDTPCSWVISVTYIYSSNSRRSSHLFPYLAPKQVTPLFASFLALAMIRPPTFYTMDTPLMVPPWRTGFSSYRPNTIAASLVCPCSRVCGCSWSDVRIAKFWAALMPQFPRIIPHIPCWILWPDVTWVYTDLQLLAGEYMKDSQLLRTATVVVWHGYQRRFVFVCLSVCLFIRMISKIDAAGITHLTYKCSTMSRGNPFILGSKGQIRSRSRGTRKHCRRG